MSLENYRKKRTFNTTPEPRGDKPPPKKQIFVVQKHAARKLHFDFRLEINGVLKSWVIPEGPSLDPSIKRLAIQVEDHPVEYASFEGLIPPKNYGAGTVMVWDSGTYSSSYNSNSIIDYWNKGHLTFVLQGQKLKGEFSLVKLDNSENDWLLIKKRDRFISEKDILEKDKSAISGKTMEEIAKESTLEWTGDGKIDLSNTPKKRFPKNIKPMLAQTAVGPFSKDGWIYEIKWDGYRVICEIENNQVDLRSRNYLSLNKQFEQIFLAASQIKHDIILDGEIVVLDSKGKPDFQALQDWVKTRKGNLVYQVFDLIYLDGHELIGLPLVERKEILSKILPASNSIKFCGYIKTQGEKFYSAAIDMDLEGIMAKDGASQYSPGVRSWSWQKIKKIKTQEAVIVGFTEPRGARKYFGALILGEYDRKDLKYIGHTGGGFSDRQLKNLFEDLKKIEQKTSSFSNPIKTNEPAHWVQPQIVVEVKYAEKTKDGFLRQPIFLRLRPDLRPEDIKQETFLPSRKVINKEIIQNSVELSHPEKVLWPKEGYTKKDLYDYYDKIADYILPHLHDRPETLIRYPNGIDEEYFYQKNIEYTLPNWAKTAKIMDEKRSEEINYLLIQNKQTLLYAVNLATIDFNPWLSRISNLYKPDFLLIDLDPENIEFKYVVRAALAVKEILDKARVISYPKTSGATGMHIYIPLSAQYPYEQIKTFAKILVSLAHNLEPKFTSLERSPAKRQGKVYLDYLQNVKGQTIASPYSVRPVEGAKVSTPLSWDEINEDLNPDAFNIHTICPRLEKIGDIFKPVLGKGISIEEALKNLGK